MKIRRMLLAALLCAIAPLTAVGASEVAQIPDYDIVLSNSSVYYWDSVYPFLNYKGVTYFPMTYDYCRAMNLATSWVEGDGLYIAYNVTNGQVPIYETTKNTKNCEVVIPTYNIYINGRKIDNLNQEYPIFNFRGVTYFPMTYDYAVNEFAWTLGFDGNALTVEAYRDTGVRIMVEEEKDDSAVLCYEYTVKAPIEGGFTYEIYNVYRRLDYKTGEITELADYVENTEEEVYSVAEPYVTFDEDGKFYYAGVLLAEIADFDEFKEKNSQLKDFSVNGYGRMRTLDGGNVLHITTIYNAKNDENYEVFPLGVGDEYTYIMNGDMPVYLGQNISVNNAYRMGDVLYFTTQRFVKTTMRHYFEAKQLYKMENGVITCLNDSFSDYNSMEIIDMVNGKLYVECLWAPEAVWELSVSPYNDGIFTFDGERLEKVANYISGEKIVTPSGDVWGIMNFNTSVAKLTK